tara:strand:- start:283 stop:465 length:183 start_codon:yes stop_codon:yes gene_type:complete
MEKKWLEEKVLNLDQLRKKRVKEMESIVNLLKKEASLLEAEKLRKVTEKDTEVKDVNAIF